MKMGIVGLPNVGKSTLFNALCDKMAAESENYPFCTIDPNVGVVNVPDYRLEKLAQIYSPKKITSATLKFIDIAGLVKGAHKGEGLGNQFLANIRQVDAIVHVVRCFEDENIIHVENSVDAIRDIETIEIELILSDLEVINRQIEKVKKKAKADKTAGKKLKLLEDLHNWLSSGRLAKNFELQENLQEDFEDEMKNLGLITLKPTIYAANLSEQNYKSDLENNQHYKKVCAFAESRDEYIFPISAILEQQLAGLEKEEKLLLLQEFGLKQSGLERLIKTGYEVLNLISYLTAGKDEVRAWTIKKNTTLPKAAGKIHSDFERGFIAAEVIAYDDFIKYSNIVTAKEKGLVRIEGKNYIVKDGDIITFRFNV